MKFLHIPLYLIFLVNGCFGQKKDVEIKENNALKSGLPPTREIVTGQINYETHANFKKLSPQFSSKAIYLQNVVAEKFEEMCTAALKDGVSLKAISGARNFNYQKGIWDRKWELNKSKDSIAIMKSILKFSSMPMTSRHHWGTDIDINSLENTYFESGKGLKEYEWLSKNANKFGFCQVYTSKESGRTGYEMEKWHWSYMPISETYLNFYKKNIQYKDIKGFNGAKLAEKVRAIEDYVHGINKNCSKN